MQARGNCNLPLVRDSQKAKSAGWPTRLESSRQRERWARFATIGFVGGTLLSLIGAVMLAINWFLASTRFGALHSVLRTTGTLMLVSIAPLLLFAGYCLDRLEGHPQS